MFKKLMFLLPVIAMLGVVGCTEREVVEPVATVAAAPTFATINSGCVVVSDDYGEREVCNTQYYYMNDGVVYWDSHFGVWVGPGGYWRGGRWWNGYYPGFHEFYGHGWYHPHGFFRAGGVRGWGRGPGFGNDAHRGGGFRGGGGHGGHR